MLPAIEFVDVDGELSFAVPRVGVTALVGGAGDGEAGRAAYVFRLIVGLTRPTDGAVLVLGQDVSRARSRATRRLQRRLAVVHGGPERGLFAAADAAGNVAVAVRAAGRVGRRGADDRVRDALDSVGLAGAAAMRPGQLTPVERLRLALARGRALRSPLLIVDAFDHDGDPGAARALARVIRADREGQLGAAVLFVRDPATVAGLADVVIDLDAPEGPAPDALLARAARA